LVPLFFSDITASTESKVITLRADEWYPYNGVSTADKPGYMIEIAIAAFEQKGYTVDYQTMPWNRAVIETRKGNFDGIVGAMSNHIPNFIIPDIELGVSKTLFWAKKELSWKYKGIKSLDNITLGAIKNYTYGDKIDSYLKKHVTKRQKVQFVYGEGALIKNLNKLLNNRIDVFIEDEIVFNTMLKQEKYTQEIVSVGQLSELKVYIAFSPERKTSEKYAKILTEAMHEFRKSGKLKEILDRYGLTDWKQSKPSEQ
jgi:polar amino acid transport system substrate-binding protein